MVCKNCETKNSQDANFCKNCGKALSEEVVRGEFSKLLGETTDVICGLFKKPIDVMKKFINGDNYLNGIIYIALNILIFSLLMLILVNMFYSSFFLGTSSGFLNTVVTNNIPYFKIFLLSIILYLLTYGIFGGVTYLVNRYVLKSNSDYKNIISWLGVNSVFLSIAYLVIILCMFVSVKLTGFVLIISLILFIYNLFNSIEYATNSDKNKLGYVLVISVLVTYLLVGFVLPKLFL